MALFICDGKVGLGGVDRVSSSAQCLGFDLLPLHLKKYHFFFTPKPSGSLRKQPDIPDLCIEWKGQGKPKKIIYMMGLRRSAISFRRMNGLFQFYRAPQFKIGCAPGNALHCNVIGHRWKNGFQRIEIPVWIMTRAISLLFTSPMHCPFT